MLVFKHMSSYLFSVADYWEMLGLSSDQGIFFCPDLWSCVGFFLFFSFLKQSSNDVHGLMPFLNKKKKWFIDKPLSEGRVRFLLSVSLFYQLISFDDSKVSRNTETRNSFCFQFAKVSFVVCQFWDKNKCKGGFFRCNVFR